jgi:hypothetical protein
MTETISHDIDIQFPTSHDQHFEWERQGTWATLYIFDHVSCAIYCYIPESN